MNAATLVGLLNLVGPSIEAGQALYNGIIKLINDARSKNEITEAEQQELLDAVNKRKEMADNDSYPEHWKQQPNG